MSVTRTLEKALEELRALPEEQQEALVGRIEDLIARAKIDAKLAVSESRGGEMAADDFFAQLRAEYGG
jgi:hypothetical protein